MSENKFIIKANILKNQKLQFQFICPQFNFKIKKFIQHQKEAGFSFPGNSFDLELEDKTLLIVRNGVDQHPISQFLEFRLYKNNFFEIFSFDEKYQNLKEISPSIEKIIEYLKIYNFKFYVLLFASQKNENSILSILPKDLIKEIINQFLILNKSDLEKEFDFKTINIGYSSRGSFKIGEMESFAFKSKKLKQ